MSVFTFTGLRFRGQSQGSGYTEGRRLKENSGGRDPVRTIEKVGTDDVWEERLTFLKKCPKEISNFMYDAQEGGGEFIT